MVGENQDSYLMNLPWRRSRKLLPAIETVISIRVRACSKWGGTAD